jgi:hypothetical protein
MRMALVLPACALSCACTTSHPTSLPDTAAIEKQPSRVSAVAALDGGPPAKPFTGGAGKGSRDGGAAKSSSGSAMVALYHLDEVDAVNLGLYDDGTFRLAVGGCDYGSLECGRWGRDGEKMRLLPRAGRQHVLWFAQSSFMAKVPEIVLTRNAPGGATAVGSSEHAGPFRQDWLPGGTCAECGAQLGPAGRHACDVLIPPCGD